MQARPMSDMDVACNSLQWWEGKSSISLGFLRLTPHCRPHGAFHCALEANSEMCPDTLTLALVLPQLFHARQGSQQKGALATGREVQRRDDAKERWCSLPLLQDTLSYLCHNDKGEFPFCSMA